MENNPAFWEWLKNRNKVDQPQEQPRLELDLPVAPKPPQGDAEVAERGVWIIEL